MISFDQARKALDRLGITMSNLQLNNLLNELLPNPQSGFGCGGVNVWGDSKSIAAVQQWHHDSTAVVPSLRTCFDQTRAGQAIDIAVQHGGHDGAHHKDWVIDQMVRVLAGDDYDKIVADACAGEDGPNTYTWEVGIAP